MKYAYMRNCMLGLLSLFLGLQFSANAQENSLLYKIEGKNIETSYLYGTIHILPQKDFVLSDRVKSAFEESELIVLELDMDDPNLQMDMMKGAMMTDGSTLDKLFSEEDYKQLDEALKAAMGMGVAPFNKMKPMLIASMLMTKYVGAQPASFEGTFIKMATEGEKEILGLETVAEQLAVFDAIPYQKQADDIAEMLDDEDAAKAVFEKMLKHYKAEEVDALYEIFEEYYEENEAEMDVMLHDRNKNWIPKIGEYAADKSVFFGVGAGHLGGEEGVIELLRAAGYTVTAIVE
ncbi:MAG: TraB/GumN family protein [Bacteroidota bacterium]